MVDLPPAATIRVTEVWLTEPVAGRLTVYPSGLSVFEPCPDGVLPFVVMPPLDEEVPEWTI